MGDSPKWVKSRRRREKRERKKASMAHASRLGQKKERKKERLNDGNNNGQATHGARKPHGPILQRNKCLIINCHFGWQRTSCTASQSAAQPPLQQIGDKKVVVTPVTIYMMKLGCPELCHNRLDCFCFAFNLIGLGVEQN